MLPIAGIAVIVGAAAWLVVAYARGGKEMREEQAHGWRFTHPDSPTQDAVTSVEPAKKSRRVALTSADLTTS